MVKTLSSQHRAHGSIPGQGTKILHATQCGQKKKKKIASQRGVNGEGMKLGKKVRTSCKGPCLPV